MRVWRYLPVLTLLLAATACGSSTTATPGPAPVATATPGGQTGPTAAIPPSPSPATQLEATKPSAPGHAPTETRPGQPSKATHPTLSAAEIQGIAIAGIRSAIADLTQRVVGDLDGLQIVSAEQVTWPDAGLGCPEPGGLYAQVLTQGIRLVLGYQSQEFDYRISGFHGRLCESDEAGPSLETQPLSGVWTRLADMPTPRSEVAAAEVDGKIYVMGGFGSGAVANEEYDPTTNTWRKRAPIPSGVDHAAAVSMAGQVYLIGGFDGSWGPTNHVWAYNPKSDTWTAQADLPTARGDWPLRW